MAACKGNEKREYFDSPEVLKGKIDTLVQWIRDSKHMIAFSVSLWWTAKERCLTLSLFLIFRELESVPGLEVSYIYNCYIIIHTVCDIDKKLNSLTTKFFQKTKSRH